jgi:hypothetical protein
MISDLISKLLTFLEKEKIAMKLREASASEFWIESLDNSLAARFVVDAAAQEISYDFFSTEYDVHLKEETLMDVEKIDFIAEEHKKWKFAEAAEYLWMILDEIKIWARKNNFTVKEKKII